MKKDLQIRIGINTGFCTVGNFGSLERLDYTAIGSTVNLAARLEALAGPGSILVSEDTHSLVEKLFVFGKPKEVKIKGFLRQIKCFELNQADYSKADILQMTGKGFEVKIVKLNELRKNVVLSRKEILHMILMVDSYVVPLAIHSLTSNSGSSSSYPRYSIFALPETLMIGKME